MTSTAIVTMTTASTHHVWPALAVSRISLTSPTTSAAIVPPTSIARSLSTNTSALPSPATATRRTPTVVSAPTFPPSAAAGDNGPNLIFTSLEFILQLSFGVAAMLVMTIKHYCAVRLAPLLQTPLGQMLWSALMAVLPIPLSPSQSIIPPIISSLSPSLPVIDTVLPSASPQLSLSQPKRIKKYTLVLDLDETLVHTTHEEIPHYDYKIPLVTQRQCRWFYVTKRPYLDLFLQSLSPHYHIVVFTASLRKYADSVIERIDPHHYIEKRLFRSSCLEEPGKCDLIKDLSAVCKNRKRVIMIDNSPTAYSHNEENAVPIDTWIDCAADSALRELIPVLVALRQADDVRTILRRRIQIREAINHR